MPVEKKQCIQRDNSSGVYCLLFTEKRMHTTENMRKLKESGGREGENRIAVVWKRADGSQLVRIPIVLQWCVT